VFIPKKANVFLRVFLGFAFFGAGGLPFLETPIFPFEAGFLPFFAARLEENTAEL